MSEALLILAVIVCGVQMRWSLRRPAGWREYPFLFACVNLGFTLPQVLRLIGDQGLPVGSLDKLLGMIVICSTCAFIGYANWVPNINQQTARSFFVLSRLKFAVVCLAVFGAIFFWKLNQLPDQVLAKSQWTGLPTIYRFFSHALFYALFIAVCMLLKGHRGAFYLPVLLAAPMLLIQIALHARRGTTILVLMAVMSLVWFQTRRRLPNLVVLILIPIAIVAMNGAGIFRGAVSKGAMYGVTRTLLDDPIGRLTNGLQAVFDRADELMLPKSKYELTNAAFVIKSADNQTSFDFGASQWNALVFRYVPAQFVGRSTKESLLLPIDPTYDPDLGYSPHPGTTITGYADAYSSFWFLGGLNFFIIGRIMRLLWERADRGNLVNQVLYAAMVDCSLEAVTHHTAIFFCGLVEVLIFCLPVFYFSRVTANATNSRPVR